MKLPVFLQRLFAFNAQPPRPVPVHAPAIPVAMPMTPLEGIPMDSKKWHSYGAKIVEETPEGLMIRTSATSLLLERARGLSFKNLSADLAVITAEDHVTFRVAMCEALANMDGYIGVRSGASEAFKLKLWAYSQVYGVTVGNYEVPEDQKALAQHLIKTANDFADQDEAAARGVATSRSNRFETSHPSYTTVQHPAPLQPVVAEPPPAVIPTVATPVAAALAVPSSVSTSVPAQAPVAPPSVPPAPRGGKPVPKPAPLDDTDDGAELERASSEVCARAFCDPSSDLHHAAEKEIPTGPHTIDGHAVELTAPEVFPEPDADRPPVRSLPYEAEPTVSTVAQAANRGLLEAKLANRGVVMTPEAQDRYVGAVSLAPTDGPAAQAARLELHNRAGAHVEERHLASDQATLTRLAEQIRLQQEEAQAAEVAERGERLKPARTLEMDHRHDRSHGMELGM